MATIPSYDNLSSGTFTTTNTKTVSHTPVTVVNGIVIASIHVGTAITSVSCTYNGVSMTSIGSASNTRQVYVFYLLNPPTGASNCIASWTTNATGILHVRTYNGVNQDTPLGTKVTNTGNSTAVSVTVSSATDELVIDAEVSLNPSACGQTQEAAGNGAGISRATGASSINMTWTVPTGVWATIAVPLLPTNFVPQIIMI